MCFCSTGVLILPERHFRPKNAFEKSTTNYPTYCGSMMLQSVSGSKVSNNLWKHLQNPKWKKNTKLHLQIYIQGKKHACFPSNLGLFVCVVLGWGALTEMSFWWNLECEGLSCSIKQSASHKHTGNRHESTRGHPHHHFLPLYTMKQLLLTWSAWHFCSGWRQQ